MGSEMMRSSRRVGAGVGATSWTSTCRGWQRRMFCSDAAATNADTLVWLSSWEAGWQASRTVRGPHARGEFCFLYNE